MNTVMFHYYPTGLTNDINCTSSTIVDLDWEGGDLQIGKFHDSNVNGVRDHGEPWLPDWEFHVIGPDWFNQVVITGSDGCVTLTDLPLDTYVVTETFRRARC